MCDGFNYSYINGQFVKFCWNVNEGALVGVFLSCIDQETKCHIVPRITLITQNRHLNLYLQVEVSYLTTRCGCEFHYLTKTLAEFAYG